MNDSPGSTKPGGDGLYRGSPAAVRLRLAAFRAPFAWSHVRVQACPEDGWRLIHNETRGKTERLKPLQSLVWTWLAALQLEDGSGGRLWLISLRLGARLRHSRDDRLFRRWIGTLPGARA